MYDKEKRFELDYLYGQVTGAIAHETVSIGRYRVHNQTVRRCSILHSLVETELSSDSSGEPHFWLESC
jgi:hypothetical protein